MTATRKPRTSKAKSVGAAAAPAISTEDNTPPVTRRVRQPGKSGAPAVAAASADEPSLFPAEAAAEPVKRGRGRPRNDGLPPGSVKETVKRGRGRPRNDGQPAGTVPAEPKLSRGRPRTKPPEALQNDASVTAEIEVMPAGPDIADQEATPLAAHVPAKSADPDEHIAEALSAAPAAGAGKTAALVKFLRHRVDVLESQRDEAVRHAIEMQKAHFAQLDLFYAQLEAIIGQDAR